MHYPSYIKHIAKIEKPSERSEINLSASSLISYWNENKPINRRSVIRVLARENSTKRLTNNTDIINCKESAIDEV